MRSRRRFIANCSLLVGSMGVKAASSSLGFKHTPPAGEAAGQSHADNTKNFIFPEFDLSSIPFSFRGSYHTLNKGKTSSRIDINTVRRSAISYKWQSTWGHNLLQLALVKGDREIPFSILARPWCLDLQGDGAGAQIVFTDKDSLLIKTQGCALRILTYRPLSWKRHLGRGNFVCYDSQPDHYYYLWSSAGGKPRFDSPADMHSGSPTNPDLITFADVPENTVLLRMITEERVFVPETASFSEVLDRTKKEIEAWQALAPAALARHESAVQTGWYLFWNLQVSPWGNYSRQTVLSSKKSMNMIWSWDICFNALALVKADHKLAWDQLFAVLDKQKANGLLPDAISDLTSSFGFNKPPVFGWTIMKMLESTPKEQWTGYLNEAVPKLIKFHNWWFENRNLNGKGICAYMHGNDSGWDNASIFDERLPVESPDLSAYLVRDAWAITFMLRHLGRETEAAGWEERAKKQLAKFKETFVTRQGLVYRTLTEKGPVPHASTCLITRIPLVLGMVLPEQTRMQLIADVSRENEFFCRYGLASESLKSPKYEPNGYWRGPVWAPSTYLIFDGLLESGARNQAAKVALAFCDMVAEKSTFNENYNAKTGEGQYDSGLSWTASDFLIMAAWLAAAGKVASKK